MSTKDKQKVIGEQLDEAQVARFLEMQPQTGENTDFHILIKAYRGLPVEAFSRFLQLFVDHGRDINAQNTKGETILTLAKQHQNQPGYAEILEQFGAR